MNEQKVDDIVQTLCSERAVTCERKFHVNQDAHYFVLSNGKEFHVSGLEAFFNDYSGLKLLIEARMA